MAENENLLFDLWGDLVIDDPWGQPFRGMLTHPRIIDISMKSQESNYRPPEHILSAF